METAPQQVAAGAQEAQADPQLEPQADPQLEPQASPQLDPQALSQGAQLDS
ncbi:MAG: hypothetical protein KF861_15550 [Planctomycetaceae bacterium]|nr:hypothetical protein [Planctomycetaceae bacterium]